MHTDIPVIYLDRKYHIDPSKMREAIIGALHDLPDTVDTVLVAMGYCVVYNRKDMRHLYVRDRGPMVDSVKKAFGHFTEGKD